MTRIFLENKFWKFGQDSAPASGARGMTSSAPPERGCLRVELASFGFSHKAPKGVDPDSIFDVRALPNPKTYATELELRMSRPTHSRKPAADTCER